MAVRRGLIPIEKSPCQAHDSVFRQLQNSQFTGRGLKKRTIPNHFLTDVAERLDLKDIPSLIDKLDKYLDIIPFPFLGANRVLKELKDLQHVENIRSLHISSDEMQITINELRAMSTSEIMDLFDGVQVLLRILFHESVKAKEKQSSKPFSLTRHSTEQQLTTRSHCLYLLHDICMKIDSVGTQLGRNDKLVEYLFIMMENRDTLLPASNVLEDILATNRKIVDLAQIANLHNLICTLNEKDFASFCHILAGIVADIDFSEDKTTLVALDKDEKERLREKSLADANQALLLSLPEFLPKLVKLAKKPLSGSPSMPPRAYLSQLRNLLLDGTVIMSHNNDTPPETNDEWQAMSADIFGNEDDEAPNFQLEVLSSPSLDSPMPLPFKIIQEVMYKVEVLYILTLFLTGKYKKDVQIKLGDSKLIPNLSDMFDKFKWHTSTDQFPRRVHSEGENCDCTPESALKIQFLRFIHSFCDHSERRHLVLTTSEVEELHGLCEKNNLEKPASLDKCKSKLRCRGAKGLMTKIIDVLKRTAANNQLRFWLCRAIEGFLRGSVSLPDQHFLMNRGLIEHILDHILDPATKCKEIFQSSFDLLGELMKFNSVAFERFNRHICTDGQFEKFISIMTLNVVDSNMFIRCIVLSLETFSIKTHGKKISMASCRLAGLMRRWEHKMYLMYKLISSISVDSLTQENVSCLNTTLIFLMVAYSSGQLHLYLQAFMKEEHAQKHPGLILNNLRDMLEFWRVHYLFRGRECTQLEQSSCIQFGHWHSVVDVLLNKDASLATSIRHYISPWKQQQQSSNRMRIDFMPRDS